MCVSRGVVTLKLPIFITFSYKTWFSPIGRGDVIDKDFPGIFRVGWQKDSYYMGGLWRNVKIYN